MKRSRHCRRHRRVCDHHGGAALRGGMPKIEGCNFGTPSEPIGPCVGTAGADDSRLASRRGHAARDGWFDCADRASSRPGPGCASCQKVLRRSRGRSIRRCVRPGRAGPGQTVGVGAWQCQIAADQAAGRSSYARAIEQLARGARTTNPSAARAHAMHRLAAAPLATSGVRRCQSAEPHASRQRSAADRPSTVSQDPERSAARTFATRKCSPTRRSAELPAPKKRSARRRPLSDQLRKVSPHFCLNSEGGPSSGFARARNCCW